MEQASKRTRKAVEEEIKDKVQELKDFVESKNKEMLEDNISLSIEVVLEIELETVEDDKVSIRSTSYAATSDGTKLDVLNKVARAL